MSTALNEIGYPKAWVDAQLSHADPNRIRATYNHAQYVEQRHVMMQVWANRLDLLALGAVEAASRHLIVHSQGLPRIPWQRESHGCQSPTYTIQSSHSLSRSGKSMPDVDGWRVTPWDAPRGLFQQTSRAVDQD